MKRLKLLNSSVLLIVITLVIPTRASAFDFNLLRRSKGTGTEKDVPVEVTANQLEFVKDDNKIIGREHVVITYKNMKMTCDYAEVYTDTKKAYAEGHVVLKRGGEVLEGEKGFYNFGESVGSFPDGQFTHEPFYGSGQQMEKVSKDKIVIENGSITTCTNANEPDKVPHYAVSASKVLIYHGDKIIARNVFVRVLDVPVFWVPFLHIPLDDFHAPLHIQPGNSSEDGFYALFSKRYSLTKNIRGNAHFDYRRDRGMGYGNDTSYKFPILGEGVTKMYIIDDKNAPDMKTRDPYDNLHNDTRYRFTWRGQTQLGERTFVRGEYNNLSDPYILKDFFEREYKEEANPKTYIDVSHNYDNFGLFLNVTKRINHFVSEIERLPELRFNWNNQEIANTGLFYKNESSVINFNRKRAHSGRDDDVLRLDTFHEFSYPKRILAVSVKPFVNWRGDYYSKNKMGKEDIKRQVIGGGVEASTKLFRVFDVKTNVANLNINRLRHIVTPNFRYDFVRERSELPVNLFKMDAIDSIDDLDVFRFGVEQRLQTKRIFGEQERTVNLVSYNSYLTYDYKSERQSGSAFTFWENVLELRPYSWLTARFDFEYDVPNDQFSQADLDLEMQQEGKWHFFAQHRFLKEDSKLLTLDGMYKLNELWGVGGYVRVEFDERDVVEEWEVRASRDLHCWLLDFGYNVRNSDIDASNHEVFFELTLKQFPEYPLKSGSRATYSRARIGDTVSGAQIKEKETEETYDLIRY